MHPRVLSIEAYPSEILNGLLHNWAQIRTGSEYKWAAQQNNSSSADLRLILFFKLKDASSQDIIHPS